MSSSEVDVVLRAARLARLRIAPEEAARLALDFGRILAAFQDLAGVDVTDVEPFVCAAELRNVLRDDVQRESLAREAVLASAPEPGGAAGEFFGVPKTVETDP